VRTRTALGTIIELRDETEATGVKLIAEVVDPLPVLNPILLRLATWLADYYCCTLEAAMRSVLPNVIRKGELRHKQRLVARLAREFAIEEIEALKRRAPVQGEIIEFLSQAGHPVAVSELSGHAVVQALVKKGLVITEPAKVERDPFGTETFVGSAELALNPEQNEVFARVKAAIESSPAYAKSQAMRQLARVLSRRSRSFFMASPAAVRRKSICKQSNSSSSAGTVRSCSCRRFHSRRRRSSDSSRVSQPLSTRWQCCIRTSAKASDTMNGTRSGTAGRVSSLAPAVRSSRR
jgi:primosomal protein N'